MWWGDWTFAAGLGGVAAGALGFFCDMDSLFMRSCITSFPWFGCCTSLSCGTLEGSVTARWPPGEWSGGDMCAFLPSPSSSIGNTLKSCWGLTGCEPGLKVVFLALSALSARNNMSSGESSWRVGMAMGAREGEGEGLSEPAESELLSGGGVGGPGAVLAGTDLDRNLGIGKADGAGEAWNVGPAYAPWFFSGVAEARFAMASVSVKEVWAPMGEKVRSCEGCARVCFFPVRGAVGGRASSVV